MLSINTISSFILAGLLTAWSCSAPQSRQYEIDKPSPNGSFRVRVMVKRGEPGTTLDQANFQFLVGEEVVDSWEWKQVDQYEEDFDFFLPIEWVDERVLEIGARRSKDVTFSDELNVSNTSEEYLKYVSISYGKSNIFKIFELGPGKQVKLGASPSFTVKGDEYSVGYGGMTQTGKRFSGILRVGERIYPDGPRKISIVISPEQLR